MACSCLILLIWSGSHYCIEILNDYTHRLFHHSIVFVVFEREWETLFRGLRPNHALLNSIMAGLAPEYDFLFKVRIKNCIQMHTDQSSWSSREGKRWDWQVDQRDKLAACNINILQIKANSRLIDGNGIGNGFSILNSLSTPSAGSTESSSLLDCWSRDNLLDWPSLSLSLLDWFCLLPSLSPALTYRRLWSREILFALAFRRWHLYRILHFKSVQVEVVNQIHRKYWCLSLSLCPFAVFSQLLV